MAKKNQGKEFILTFRFVSNINKRGTEFMEAVEKNNLDACNIILYLDSARGSVVYAALDTASDSNSIGMCTKIEDKQGNTYTGEQVRDFIEDDNYEVTFNKIESKNIYTLNVKELVDETVVIKPSLTLEEAVEKVINAKICTKTELNERIKVMRANRVSETIIAKTIASYKKYDREIRKPSAIFIDPDPKSEESIMQSALISAGTKRPTIFNGLHSSGKNVCAETLAWLLNKPYFLVGISAHSDTEELFGSKATEVPELNNLSDKELLDLAKASIKVEQGSVDNDDIKKAARYDALKAKAASVAIKTELSEFVDWLQTGGVLMLNEINMAEPNFLQKFINPIGDGTGFITTSNGRIDIHEDCWLLGSMNENYTGSMPQNMATGTRFKHIIFPAPKSIRKQLVSSVNAKLDKKYFEACEKCYKDFKGYIQGNSMVSQQCLNIRGFKEALEEVAYAEGETTLRSKIIECVINGCVEEERYQLITILEDAVHI